ncbi:MAG: hypothetical protein A3C10_03420 [Candidatus Magasanikbacteria bacterium RIFCSPHIGHO2_02_FULL_48_18]|nr:MAG: hypothetical protein A3I74_03140 [Candidatus Magasanikbacteria bacterium RIFCSPLOWO2_02_FULL_47_16]OGH80207.1 MAG: hypothetical protein A3C10_03420 [Candidatus Magasanikbacteria bacterium RIFCSPHIGHO2_02_FULL_48_18]
MNMEKKIICPICKGEDTSFFCKKNGFTVYQCIECFLLFVWPLPFSTESVYHKDYFLKDKTKTDFGYADYDQDKEPMRQIFLETLQMIEECGCEKKLFDVGAATGFFLDIAKERGWETSGVDISNYASECARKKGHAVSSGTLSSTRPEGKYGAVTMFDVLEHMTDPLADLTIVNSIVQDKGLLVINTVNCQSLWARLLGKRWNMIIPPEHLFYFSKQSLNMLLKKVGFQIVDIKKIKKNFSLPYIFLILHNWQKFVVWRKLSQLCDIPLLRKLSLPINLGDNILVTAKKIKDV